MDYARLGDTGLIVSRLAFGAATFGAGQGAMAAMYKVDQAGADRMVGAALDAGITYFNTADAYAAGRSEEMLGQALGARRRDVVIASKVGSRVGPGLNDQGLSRRHILAAVEASLKRLGTDWIDVYLAHRPDPLTPLEETLAAFQQIFTDGKARHIGYSNWPAWLVAKAVGIQRRNGWSQFRAAEMYYSLLGRDLEHESLPCAIDHGIGVQVWSPLAGGFLTGRYTRADPTGGGGRLTGFDIIPFDRERGYDLVARLQAIAAARGATPSQVAIAWLLARGGVTSVLIGASRDEQLADNLGAAAIRLDAAETEALDALSAPAALYPGWYNARFVDQPATQALAAIRPSG